MTEPADFAFQALAVEDLPTVRGWLAAPHVKRWWRDAWTDTPFASLQAGEVPDPGLEMLRVDLDGRPVGYAQVYDALGDGTFWHGAEGVTDATRGIDFLIGEAELVNRKIGRVMLRALAAHVFADPSVDRIVTDPHRDNWPCIIALKRAGFRERGRLTVPGVNAMHLTLARGVFKG